jgi:hypothetical protein
MSDMTITLVDEADLVLHPDNPRRGEVDAIAESLLVSGQYKPLVVSRGTSHVLAGNHTLLAIRKLNDGWRPTDMEDAVWERRPVATVLVDVDAEGEKRILAVDNRTSDLGSYDNAALVALLDSMGTLEGSGYSDDDLDTLRFLIGQEPTEVLTGATDAHYNGEDSGEREQREAAVGNYQPLAARGMAEMILVMPNTKHEQAVEWIQRLRGRWGVELTNGDIVYKALAEAIEE